MPFNLMKRSQIYLDPMKHRISLAERQDGFYRVFENLNNHRFDEIGGRCWEKNKREQKQKEIIIRNIFEDNGIKIGISFGEMPYFIKNTK